MLEGGGVRLTSHSFCQLGSPDIQGLSIQTNDSRPGANIRRVLSKIMMRRVWMMMILMLVGADWW